MTVNFLIVAFILFLLVRSLNSLKHSVLHEENAAPVKPRQEVLLEEIRDLLAKHAA